MGDRVSVEITVLTEKAEQTFNLLKECGHYHSCEYTDIVNDDYHSFSYEDEATKLNLTAFILYEVNYANVDSENSELCDLGIAHNVHWEQGCNFEAGRKYFRFNADGTVKRTNDLPADQTPSVNAYQMLAKLDTHSIEEIKQYLNEIIEEFAEPSWLNQSEYGILATQILATKNQDISQKPPETT